MTAPKDKNDGENSRGRPRKHKETVKTITWRPTSQALRDAVVSLGASRWIDKMAREATGIKE